MTSDDMTVSKGLGFPLGGATRRGARACARDGRGGRPAGVLCGGY